MELEFTLEKADLLAYANFARSAVARELKPATLTARIFWYIGCVGFLIAGILTSRDNTLAPLLVYFGILLTLFVYQKYYLKLYFSAYHSQKYFPDVFVPQKLIIGEASLVNIRQTSKSEFGWKGINQIVHTDKHTFILLHNFTGFIVPHRVFNNSTEIQGFKDRLNAVWTVGKTENATSLKNLDLSD